MGPSGIAFKGDQIYVVNDANGCIYRFGKNGGSASADKSFVLQCLPDKMAGSGYSGIAFDKRKERLFIAQQDPGSIIEVNPENGQVLASWWRIIPQFQPS